MLERLRNLVWDEEGQGLVEYALIIALISVAVLVGIGLTFVTPLKNLFSGVGAKLVVPE
ncbi:MAG TPA: Flp family type IVb pilin [Aminobacterium sp.]|jgi:pilus assembly protein Flp/PilA|uniref:Flp family type IVb pilin n=1 Tax=Aminobacterium TaxID=81466 RepID=UPI000ED61C6A|nr:Flp family type IVb pilin [Aminobacterium sp. UBA4834]HCA41260.1 Flp family type IVb pilin [Aminobacterium sp.]